MHQPFHAKLEQLVHRHRISSILHRHDNAVDSLLACNSYQFVCHLPPTRVFQFAGPANDIDTEIDSCAQAFHKPSSSAACSEYVDSLFQVWLLNDPEIGAPPRNEP